MPRTNGPNKKDLWLKYYLDDDNKKTFMNATASAKAAGYNANSENAFQTLGSENLRKRAPTINKWIEEIGLSEEKLKKKLHSLMSAKETKFFAKDGIVIEKHDVEALGIQQRALDMGMRFRGMFEKDNIQQKPDNLTEEMIQMGKDIASKLVDNILSVKTADEDPLRLDD